MSISRDEVLRVAALARLDLDEAELRAMVADLGSILDYVKHLDRITGDGAPAGEEGGGTPLRVDRVEAGLEPGAATGIAPVSENGLFKVPPAFEEG